MNRRAFITGGAIAASVALINGGAAFAQRREKAPKAWRRSWPDTDFSKSSVEFHEIFEGGPGRDGIPSIDKPIFTLASAVRNSTNWIADNEPVISVEIAGDARAYSVAVLMRHEIVNDVVGGTPVAITYCPLCNSAVVFDRRHEGTALEFGTTGKLRNSDMVMYDRQTNSWWQQFVGKAIVGTLTGAKLGIIPTRMESFGQFLNRYPEGYLLTPNGEASGRYGNTAYEKYDSERRPPLYDGRYRGPVPALARVVAVGDKAWSLALIKKEKRLETGDLIIAWQAGQSSALDTRHIRRGKDVGNVVVQRKMSDGSLVDAAHQIPFAFAFKAFYPKGTITTHLPPQKR